jgi:hypothetical protein
MAAAKRRKNAAHSVSRGEMREISEPRTGRKKARLRYAGEVKMPLLRPEFPLNSPSPKEYNNAVRRLISASVAAFALLFVFSAIVLGQINAPPSSVTSPGFGGRAVNGTPPSVTSLGPNGYAPTPAPNSQHHHHHKTDAAPLLYAYPVPYAAGDAPADNNSDANDDDPNYQGGPTVFDRRGSGADSYVPPVNEVPKPHAAVLADNSSADQAPPTPTLLVFKDGHQVEVANYAIVGPTLFDLTPGHSRKISLTDLDLAATQQKNEDRGVVFQLPSSQAN